MSKTTRAKNVYDLFLSVTYCQDAVFPNVFQTHVMCLQFRPPQNPFREKTFVEQVPMFNRAP